MSLRKLFVSSAVAAGLAAVAASPASAAGSVNVTYEAPGVEHTTLSFLTVVEKFDELAAQAYSGVVSTAVGTYSGLTVKPNDMYAGAGGVGAGTYSSVSSGQTTLMLGKPSTYFGLWFAAQDENNQIDFRSNGQVVYSFTGNQMRSAMNDGAYYGNPDSITGGQRDNQWEPYAFINFQATGGLTFDEVDFKQNSCGCMSFETDNHTIAAAPEPAIWALMIIGVGGMGAALRTRRRRITA